MRRISLQGLRPRLGRAAGLHPRGIAIALNRSGGAFFVSELPRLGAQRFCARSRSREAKPSRLRREQPCGDDRG